MTHAERAGRTRAADALCAQAFAAAGCPETGVALVAVAVRAVRGDRARRDAQAAVLRSTTLETEREAQEIAAPSFEFFTLYGVAAVYYWVVCLVLSFNQDRLETRLSRYVAA